VQQTLVAEGSWGQHPLNMSLSWMITPAASSAPDVVTILLFLPPPIVLSPETSPTDQRYDPLLGVKSKKKKIICDACLHMH
jgi:hypothetical protein